MFSVAKLSGNRAILPTLALLFGATLAHGNAISIPVICAGAQVGVINMDSAAGGVSGDFTTIPNPPNAGSLAAAAAVCGEDHFNWYQIVTADNQAPKNFAGVQLNPPYVDPPPGGYDINFDNTWADKLPWYWDEGVPPVNPPGQVVKPGLSLAANTTATNLHFEDFPGGANGLALSFRTWLVSLNADSSFHAFEGGFSWGFSKSNTGVVTITAPVSLGAVNPTAAQYKDIIGGFQTAIPEPSSLSLLLGGAMALLAASRRRRK